MALQNQLPIQVADTQPTFPTTALSYAGIDL
jgi:hypothetical protein